MVNGGIFVEYISMAFTVACLCSATPLHNSEHKKSESDFSSVKKERYLKSTMLLGLSKKERLEKNYPKTQGKNAQLPLTDTCGEVL